MGIREWEKTVRAYGCIVTGAQQDDGHVIQFHHVYGRKFKTDKLLVGPWYGIPLCVRLHDSRSTDPHSVSKNRVLFTETFGLQRDLFAKLCEGIRTKGIILPFGQDYYDAIMRTSR